MVARITMVGFGLLASSIAAAIKQAKLPTKIRAVSSPATLKRARELELADEFFEYDETEKWAKDSDLILLCAPILHILKMIDALGKVSWAGTNAGREILVSDIGSTKVEICKAGVRLPAPFRFVGSHPMAGSEKRTCELLEIIRFVGANPVVFPPEHHDRTMAWVSHMPQMLSSTLAGNLPERLLKHNYQHFAGRAFRDMTRIAASGWGMWHDIAVTNRDETTRALCEVRDGLDKTIAAMNGLNVVKDGKPASGNFENDEHSVVADNSQALADIFKAGNDGRASLFAPGRNNTNSFYEITVQLKDKPGALLSVMQPLAEEGINIRDIELMKVRENVAGTLLLAFKTQEEAARAVKTLQYLEYEVKERR